MHKPTFRMLKPGQNMRRSKTWILIPVLLVLAACQEKSDDTPTTAIQPEHLPMHSWQLEKVTLQLPPATTESDVTSNVLFDCEKDDLVRFPSGRAFLYSDNGLSCSGTGKVVFRSLDGATWAYQGADSTIRMAKGFNRQTFKVISLNASAMHLWQETLDYFGLEARYHFYFTAK
jgi:hypothetical protein